MTETRETWRLTVGSLVLLALGAVGLWYFAAWIVGDWIPQWVRALFITAYVLSAFGNPKIFPALHRAEPPRDVT